VKEKEEKLFKEHDAFRKWKRAEVKKQNLNVNNSFDEQQLDYLKELEGEFMVDENEFAHWRHI
jgi:hypothetical protein